MLIVADENIPLLEAFFGALGTLRRLPGRSITADDVREADVLLVRSVTRVDAALLEGSKVRFVGTCTIGTDHLDTTYLAQRGVAWSSAPGCNARGVVDYVLSSLTILAQRNRASLSGRRYGVVGAGEVGGRLSAVLNELGWQVWVCDPPRQQREGGDFVTLETIVRECDVISVHTPLDADTRHLFDENVLRLLRPGTWLVNAARGPVVDNTALKTVLLSRSDLQVVLDVWEHEPYVDPELAALCQIVTPHIAGYSYDGKVRGTAQVYQACCAALGLAVTVELASLLPAQWLMEMTLSAEADVDWAMLQVCRAVYDPRDDDQSLRQTLQLDAAAQRGAFDLLRKHYPLRRELDALTVRVNGVAPALTQRLRALGVTVC